MRPALLLALNSKESHSGHCLHTLDQLGHIGLGACLEHDGVPEFVGQIASETGSTKVTGGIVEKVDIFADYLMAHENRPPVRLRQS